MVAVTLPDGSKREFAAPVTIAEVAQSIGSGLAKAALAGSVDGRLVDLSHTIDRDGSWPSLPIKILKVWILFGTPQRIYSHMLLKNCSPMHRSLLAL